MSDDIYRPDQTISKEEIEQFKNIHHLHAAPIPVDIETESLAEVKVKKIDWLWKNVAAYGKLTLFAGEPGVGKSQLLLYIASIVSQGKKFHFERENCQKGKVLLVSGEDGCEDTIKPRLLALGADLVNIDNVKGIKKYDKHGNLYYDALCLVENIADLEKKIKEKEYKLLIIDPISVYLGSIDENKNKEIRSALAIITALAQRHNLALIINSHFTKPSGSSNKNAIYRVMGSIGFAAAARIVYGIMKDPELPQRRLFVPIKNNIGQDKEGYVYEIKPIFVEGNVETSKVEWLNERIDKTANEILNFVGVNSPKLEEVKHFLTEMLKNGSIPLTDIRRQATEKGFSVDRLYKAKEELKIYETSSFGGKRGKIWMLSQ
jgi:putative DNA primase/helicase